jgi:protein-S-isoprenylcysteine O-methyltransferase Ste14
MPTQETDAQHRGLGAAAKSVSEHLSAILRLEAELAALEVKRKIKALGIGIGLGVGAAIFLVFMFGFLFATVAAAFATFLSTWLALLVVTGILFVTAGLLGFLAIKSINKGAPPVPEQAIREAKLTSNALKSNGTGT